MLVGHARAAFGMIGADPKIAAAKRVLAWIESKHKGEFSQRECHHDLQGTFPRVAELRPALDVLEERYYIFPLDPQTSGPGRRSKTYQVNPRTFEEVMQ